LASAVREDRERVMNKLGGSAGRETARRYALAGVEIEAPKLASGLYLVATPIGNLRDVTLRALEILAAADLIACEDTRVSRKLLDRYGIKRPLMPYHDRNAEQARPKILRALAEGSAVALISDAGTPLVSDPGFKLVRAAQAAGHAVTAAPGASSVLTALVLAGLPTDSFLFDGFLPAKPAQRRARIAELARIPATLVLFESGQRLAATLRDLSSGLGTRDAAVCRELTKLHEEIRRGDLAALAQHYEHAGEKRGEIALVIAPAARQAADAEPAEIDELLRAALARSSVKDAVAEVAMLTGQSRRELYRQALALREDSGHDAPD
jgi:16S rRNA (cytidine1402-2'-O)-methyltransferase